MKLIKKGLLVLTIATMAVMILATGGCFPSEDDDEVTQIVTVERGDLEIRISAFGNVTMPHQAMLTFNNISGISVVEEVYVKFGDTVKKGDVLAKLDTSSLERSVTLAKGDLRLAEIDLEQSSSSASLASAKASVENAKVLVRNAQESMEYAQNNDTSAITINLQNAQRDLIVAQKNGELNVAAAEELVKTARETWNNYVQENIDQLGAVPSVAAHASDLQEDIEQAKKNLEVVKETAAASISVAQAALNAAERALSNAPALIQQKEADVASAKAVLLEAESNLANIESGLDIEVKKIMIDKAQVSLDIAEEYLAQATMKAPFDGVIAAAGPVAGDEINSSTVIVHLLDTSQVEINAAVDAIDVSYLHAGQNVVVELNSISDVQLNGELLAISPIGVSQSGMVTYAISVKVNDVDKYELRDGMKATIDISVSQAEDVLWVPGGAIRINDTGSVVLVVNDDGDTEEQLVEVGITNGQQTQILNGLGEGEQVLVQGWIPDTK